MTLDEEIKRLTYNAEYERTHGSLQGCLDFRQLAEWLRELKKWRDFGDSIGRVLGKHFTKEELFKMMEVNADGDSN